MTRLSRLRFMDVDRTRLPVRRRIRSRGVPNALQAHPVAYTTECSEAAQVTSQLLGPATVTPVRGARRDFQCTFNAVQFLDVTMAYLDYAVATDIVVSRAADAYSVHMTTSGQEGRQAHGGPKHGVHGTRTRRLPQSAAQVRGGTVAGARVSRCCGAQVARPEGRRRGRISAARPATVWRDPQRCWPLKLS